MKTIEEVKTLLDDNINWGEILKDVVLQKFGENKLISNREIYSHSVGDPDAFLTAVIVSNGNVFVYFDIMYGSDFEGFEFGVLETNKNKLNKDNIYISQNALKEFTRLLIYGEPQKYDNIIEYDFNNELSKVEREDMSFERISSALLDNDMFYNKTKEILKNGIGRICY